MSDVGGAQGDAERISWRLAAIAVEIADVVEQLPGARGGLGCHRLRHTVIRAGAEFHVAATDRFVHQLLRHGHTRNDLLQCGERSPRGAHDNGRPEK